MDSNKTNTYLKFDKSRMVNLEYSLKREILRTNRRGAYHCTTLVECNTRKQHGLLVLPVPKLNNTNHVLLSSFDETVIQHGADFNLGIHKYDGDNYSPMGHKYIREFNCDSLPRTIYRVGGVILSKEKMFSLKDNTILIRYTLLDAHSPTTMRFKPFLAFRENNALTSENTVANHGYKEVENGISMCMYSGYPDLFMQFSKEVNFVFDPHWNKGIEYTRDQEDGLPYKEDLYVPGYFELPIKKGESIIFSASDVKADTSKLSSLFLDGIKERTPRSSFYNCLKNSAHQFYFRPTKDDLYLLNSYPWGRVKAREQFMSLPGLTIGIGRPEAFEEIVDTAVPTIEAFMQNKPIEGFLSDIGNADVLLWFVWALKRYADADKERFYAKYADLTKRVVSFIQEGKHPNLTPLTNGLLTVDSQIGYPCWMNNSDSADTPRLARTGCLVEVNAFWYNALRFTQDIAENLEEEKLQKKMALLAEVVRTSFIEVFLNDSGYLYDYAVGNYVDWSVRPNMLLAISLDYPLLDRRQSKSVLDFVTKELLTPKGIRTLSPKSIGFRPRVEGSIENKIDSAYRGAAWPWLLGPYMEAYLKIFQRSGYSFLDRLLIGVEEEMSNDCIGSLSALYDGNIPYFGHGPISYSISVAGVLRAINLQRSFADEY
ncbi:glycogen debranching enzyme family protein [Dysgonomonas sp. Marseille-P4677]|uniref:glycogen debranching enzyme N-terminal domain-containing protein n=1 Tax=Dysgonomonas sp. Marseille-P4677 TaxID=2364790 RepID=UPI0019115F7B|nr:glycogen debranching enzyme N-terminal domain-containing protein [Dysgonomonas sp. Marseille-P4677]MBK5722549.1 glycogen debranching enzyme family protein [Dysgonomonas sp. Marseille-P4677]